MSLKRSILLLLFVALSAAGCGKKGNPTPPVPIIPQGTTDLLVTQRGGNIILSWSFPTSTAAGTRLEKIDRVVVYRYVETLPVTAAAPDSPATQPGTTEAGTPLEVQLFAPVTGVLPQQFEKLKETVASIENDELPAFVAGARILYEDQPQFRTSDNRPVRVNYAVVTEAARNRSALSNIATIVPLQVPAPPQNLRATAEPAGLKLEWQRPANADEVGLIGYNVYRFPPTGEIQELGKPVNTAPVDASHYLDAPPYGEYRYLVTAVRSAGPPPVESEPTPTVLAQFRDVVPPPAPVGVVTLTEENAIRLLWEAVEAPDFAGYRVYRRPGGGTDELLTAQPTLETNFRDEPPQRGVAYIYSVSSVDANGNESAKVEATPSALPQ